MRYDFWVIRYVPDPIRDERVNVGVIAGTGDDWAVRRVHNARRAARLGGSATASETFFADVQRRIETELEPIALLGQPDQDPMSLTLVDDWRIRMNNLIQISDARPVLADSAAEAADMAFDLMVVDDHHEVKHRSRTQVLRRLKGAFAEDAVLVEHLRSGAAARVGEQSTKIDLAVADQEVVQLSHAWAFDLMDLEQLETNIHAWNYMMGLLRADGGLLTPRRRDTSWNLRIAADVPIRVVYREPKTLDGETKLRNAIDGWRHLGVHALEEREAGRVVDEARELIAQ